MSLKYRDMVCINDIINGINGDNSSGHSFPWRKENH